MLRSFSLKTIKQPWRRHNILGRDIKVKLMPAVFILDSVGQSYLRELVSLHVTRGNCTVADTIEGAVFVVGMDRDPNLENVDWQKRVVLMPSKPTSMSHQDRWFNSLTLYHWGQVDFSLADMFAQNSRQ